MSRAHSSSIKKLVPFFAAIGALLLLVGAAPMVQASNNAPLPGAIVRPEPLVFELEVGEEKTLDIVIEDAVDVYGAQVEGTFDPNAVAVVDANLGLDGVQMTAGNLPVPGMVSLNSADNTAGTFGYAITQINPQLPASGNGIIVSLKLMGKTIGLSELEFTKVIIADRRCKSTRGDCSTWSDPGLAGDRRVAGLSAVDFKMKGDGLNKDSKGDIKGSCTRGEEGQPSLNVQLFKLAIHPISKSKQGGLR